ncbi:MAG: hypothetical protein C0404_14575 [Verrucomicrobia bacterium]|nr:hypothetical protein [Verrucomicrobiota bacterium]
MASTEQQVSPEEKLLKVIQGDGKVAAKPTPEEKMLSAVKPPSGAPVPGPKTVRVPGPPTVRIPPPSKGEPAPVKFAPPVPAQAAAQKAAPPAEPVADKSKLKILKPEPPAAKPQAETTAAAPRPEVTAKPLVLQPKKRAAGRFAIGRVNLGLVALILVILGFTAHEIWACVGMKAPTALPSPSVFSGSNDAGTPKDPAAIIKAFTDANIFIDPGLPPIDPTNRPPQPPEPKVNEIQKNLKVIGFSGSEAILVDARDSKMFVVKSGQKFSVGDQVLELVEIQSDRVIVLAGGQKMVLTAGMVVTPQPAGGGPVERKK